VNPWQREVRLYQKLSLAEYAEESFTIHFSQDFKGKGNLTGIKRMQDPEGLKG